MTVRPQYHLKKVGAHTHIWDIRKLLAQADADGLPVEEVPLAGLAEIDEPYWFSTLPSCRRVLEHARLIEAADLSFPILLFPDGRVMDGMHRVMRALKEGRDTIAARRLRHLPPPDHVDVALEDLDYGPAGSR